MNLGNSDLVVVSTITFFKRTSLQNTILHTRFCFVDSVSVEANQFSQSEKYFAPPIIIFTKTIKPAFYPSPRNKGQKG